jgi:hypothetical protein
VNTVRNFWVSEKKDDLLTGKYCVEFVRFGKSCTVIKDLFDTDYDAR